MWQQVLAEFTITHLRMTQLSGSLSTPCKGKGDVDAQRALAYVLWTELNREVLEGRALLAGQSRHWPHMDSSRALL